MIEVPTKQGDKMDIIDQCLNVASRAENVKGYVLQAQNATEDGAAFLHAQATEALRDIIRQATVTLALFEANPYKRHDLRDAFNDGYAAGMVRELDMPDMLRDQAERIAWNKGYDAGFIARPGYVDDEHGAHR